MNRMFPSTLRLSAFLCLSMCLGIGILRFSYTALLPATRDAYDWSQQFASVLGSANLLGYLMGAFWAMLLPQGPKVSYFIRYAALLGAVSLFACAFSSFHASWYLIWRVLSGIAGGLLMVLSPSLVAQCSELKNRFKISVIGFSGIGIGVLISTLFMPYLDRISTPHAWLILCGFALIITVLLWVLIYPFQNQQSAPVTGTTTDLVTFTPIFFSLLMVYACSAFAYIPHSLFWIDYLSHSLNLNLYWINFNWVLYGVGSALGAATAYALARIFGNVMALKVLYSLYVLAVGIAIFYFSAVLTLLSSFLTGLLNPAVVFLTSYTLLQLYGVHYKKLWGIATLSFAAVQLIGGLTFSILQHRGWSYNAQFMLAAGVLALGTLQFFYFTRSGFIAQKTS